ncbi:hypothetical protein [Microbacterium indicum]|uniref:hypothetical protein n=1 Tax=Microbacterium indicum TaxID=358100 RepID=UPI00040039DE|nr:hypothetical protein [Microbacterium indicum]
MPTALPRHSITETPDVAAALRAASRRWPEDAARPAALLRRLIDEGGHAIGQQNDAARARRLAALDEAAGALTGTYEAGYLDALRDEWPA